MIEVPDEFSVELMRAARGAGATPIVEVRHTRINREIVRGTNEKHANLVRSLELFRMKKSFRLTSRFAGATMRARNSDVPGDRMAMYSRINPPGAKLSGPANTRWCVLRWPSPSMAQAAGMSTEGVREPFILTLHNGLPQNGGEPWRL